MSKSALLLKKKINFITLEPKDLTDAFDAVQFDAVQFDHSDARPRRANAKRKNPPEILKHEFVAKGALKFQMRQI